MEPTSQAWVFCWRNPSMPFLVLEERLVVELKEQLWQLPARLGFIPEARELIGWLNMLAVHGWGCRTRSSCSPQGRVPGLSPIRAQLSHNILLSLIPWISWSPLIMGLLVPMEWITLVSYSLLVPSTILKPLVTWGSLISWGLLNVGFFDSFVISPHSGECVRVKL